MSIIKLLSATAVLVHWLAAPTSSMAADASLKDAFRNKFMVGAAIGTNQALGEEPAALKLVAGQFNTITPENLLKWGEVHPEPDRYIFEPADRFVKFGEENKMFIVGHNLVWHNQTPDWVFQDDAGKPLDREALLKRMREHIQKVVGRYKGRIGAWDVVNEAIDDDGTLRKTKWHAAIGDDYVIKAFQYAHEADPKAELYYNDFNEWHAKKRQAIKKLVQDLKSKGVRIDGVGLQGHWGIGYPSIAEIETMLNDYHQLGVKLMITELDITMLPSALNHRGADLSQNEELRKKLNPYPEGLPNDLQQQFDKRYQDIFRIFVKHADKIDRVTFWGVYDGHSWLNYWPVAGRADYPLLFDRQLRPKPAFEAVLKTASPK